MFQNTHLLEKYFYKTATLKTKSESESTDCSVATFNIEWLAIN